MAFMISLIICSAIIVMLPSCFSRPADELVLPLHTTREFAYVTPAETSFSITWAVNTSVVSENTQFSDEIAIAYQKLPDGSTQGNLTFRADAEGNNTNILCVITNFINLFTYTFNYTIIIQGILSPPTDVTYVESIDELSRSVEFSWSAPFSLNITDEEPDILYYVINIIDNYNTTTTMNTTTMNTTETQYILHADLCTFHVYQVEIAAVNVVGVGEKYMNPQLSLEGMRLSDAKIVFSKGVPEINIQISSSCPGEFHYEAELIPTYSNKRLIINKNSTRPILTLSSTDIQLNEIYKLVVRTDSMSGPLQSFNLSTFDVQNVEINHSNDEEYTNITCHFAQGSEIPGCRITVKQKYDKEGGNYVDCELIASRMDKDTEATIAVRLPKGTYTVLVYDFENMVTENAAFNTTITISTSSQMQASGCIAKLFENHQTTEHWNNMTYIGVGIGLFLILTIAAVIFSFMFCKLKGRKRSLRTADQNDYTDTTSFQKPPIRTQSSESSDTTHSVTSAGISDPLQQSISSTAPLIQYHAPPSTQPNYAEVQLLQQPRAQAPSPLSHDEPVAYSTIQTQEPKSLSQGRTDAGDAPNVQEESLL